MDKFAVFDLNGRQVTVRLDEQSGELVIHATDGDRLCVLPFVTNVIHVRAEASH